MKINKRLINLISIASILSLFPISSYANSDITIDQSFTYEDGLWKPGRVESKEFYINNNKENDISIDRLYMSLKSSEYWKTGDKLDINSEKFKEFAKYSTVTLKHNNDVLFEDKFENLLSEDGIDLSKDIDIKAKGKELLNMTIDMDLEMDNDAQALNNVFNIGIAYKMDEKPKPPVDPEDPTKPTNPDTGGGGSDKLPQTGGVINSASLIAIGTVAIGAGVVLNRKPEEEGGKHNE